jgi:drug/metabolite transporter (DMT)-like permease
VSHAGLDLQKLEVLLVVGWTAGSLGALLVVRPEHRPRRTDLLVGLGIGLYNLVALVAILTALGWLNAAAFFPTVACVSVILDSLTAHFFWKERLGPLAWLGVCLAVVAVVLVLQNHP